MKKKIIIFTIVVLFLIIINHFFLKNLDNDQLNNSNKNLELEIENEEIEKQTYSSNVLENVNYSSIDPEGNEYSIFASEGEIDIKNNQTIFLKNVKASIKLKN